MPEIPLDLQDKLGELHNWKEFWAARQQRVVDLVETGMSYRQVAAIVGLSYERVRAIYRKLRPDAPPRRPGRKPPVDTKVHEEVTKVHD